MAVIAAGLSIVVAAFRVQSTRMCCRRLWRNIDDETKRKKRNKTRQPHSKLPLLSEHHQENAKATASQSLARELMFVLRFLVWGIVSSIALRNHVARRVSYCLG